MRNKKLLVSDPTQFSNLHKINPYYDEKEIDVARAVEEHKRIVECFREAGIEVVQVAAPVGCQDGVYTANWGLVYHGKAVMARLPEARRGEEEYARKVLEGMGIDCVSVPNEMLFSGQGDSLRVSKYLIGGNGYRSEAQAQEFAAKELGLELVLVKTRPKLNEDGSVFVNPETKRADSFFYDLDLAVAVISDELSAYCPEALESESVEKIEALPMEKIKVSLEEAVEGFACNLVSTGETVIMSSRAPKLKEELEKRGLRVLTPEVSELIRGGGFIRCVSLEIE